MISIIKNIIEKSEWKFVAIATAILIIITAVPYVYGYLNAPDGFKYLGLHSLTAGDITTYYSYIMQTKNGHFIFQNLFTGETTAYNNFNIFWLSVGIFAKIFNLSPLAAFQLSRILLIPSFVISLYLLCAYFFSEKSKRKTALVLLVFSSGVGALLNNFLGKMYSHSPGIYNKSMDLWVPESNVFLSAYHTPHFVASFTLIALIFLLMLISLDTKKMKYSFFAGFWGLILFQFHTFHFITIAAVLFVYEIIISFKKETIAWERIKHYLLFAIISLPSVVYHIVLLKYDWFTQQKALQNLCLSPKLIFTITTFGLTFLLAVLGAYFIFKQKKFSTKNIFILTWFFVNGMLLYAPITFQRRLIEGWQIPMVMLATVAIFKIKSWLEKHNVKWEYWQISLAIIAIIIFAFSNIFNIARDIISYNQQYPLFYLEQDYFQGYQWLADNLSDKQIVLSGAKNNNFIPGFAGVATFAGHSMETVFFDNKEVKMKWFFKNNNGGESKKNFLKNNNIEFIFYSPDEQKMGAYNPRAKKYLKKVYKNKLISIYKVKL